MSLFILVYLNIFVVAITKKQLAATPWIETVYQNSKRKQRNEILVWSILYMNCFPWRLVITGGL